MLYKVLHSDGYSWHGEWPLPTKLADGSWKPGSWIEVTGDLVPCVNGLHGCDGTRQLLRWLGPPLVCEMEYDGDVVVHYDKIVGRRARLLRIIEAWNERTARLFACDCAEHVLPIWESQIGGDVRPRLTIATARRFADGMANRDALAAARVSAWEAISASAATVDSEVRSSAWAAYETANRRLFECVAGAIGRHDPGTDERDWQAERLHQYLDGEV